MFFAVRAAFVRAGLGALMLCALLLAPIEFVTPPRSAPAAFAQAVPIPQLALWETNMRAFGSTHCAPRGAGRRLLRRHPRLLSDRRLYARLVVGHLRPTRPDRLPGPIRPAEQWPSPRVLELYPWSDHGLPAQWRRAVKERRHPPLPKRGLCVRLRAARLDGERPIQPRGRLRHHQLHQCREVRSA